MSLVKSTLGKAGLPSAEPTAMVRLGGTMIPCAEHIVRPIPGIGRQRRTR
jgi:hypothetical protein